MEHVNTLSEWLNAAKHAEMHATRGAIYSEAVESLLLCLAPFAPHLVDERTSSEMIRRESRWALAAVAENVLCQRRVGEELVPLPQPAPGQGPPVQAVERQDRDGGDGDPVSLIGVRDGVAVPAHDQGHPGGHGIRVR